MDKLFKKASKINLQRKLHSIKESKTSKSVFVFLNSGIPTH